jgi:alpha-tubulin suppressor-like RCC1 family protein
VWTWGLNSTGQLGDGTTTNRRVPVKVAGLSGGFGLGGGVNYSVVLHT